MFIGSDSIRSVERDSMSESKKPEGFGKQDCMVLLVLVLFHIVLRTRRQSMIVMGQE